MFPFLSFFINNLESHLNTLYGRDYHASVFSCFLNSVFSDLCTGNIEGVINNICSPSCAPAQCHCCLISPSLNNNCRCMYGHITFVRFPKCVTLVFYTFGPTVSRTLDYCIYRCPTLKVPLTDLSAVGIKIPTAVIMALLLFSPTTFLTKYYQTFHIGLTLRARASCRALIHFDIL